MGLVFGYFLLNDVPIQTIPCIPASPKRFPKTLERQVWFPSAPENLKKRHQQCHLRHRVWFRTVRKGSQQISLAPVVLNTRHGKRMRSGGSVDAEIGKMRSRCDLYRRYRQGCLICGSSPGETGVKRIEANRPYIERKNGCLRLKDDNDTKS